jgi:anti-sigma regulatory factor (Ser/Thr protein kinase)
LKTLRIWSDLAELEKARAFLKTSLEGFPVSEEDFFKVELSLIEICVNVIRYAYPEKPGKILIRVWQQDGRIVLEIADMGLPFDPTKMEEPDIPKNLKEGSKPKLGIFLTRKLMDGFEYRRSNNRNILTLYKEI